MNLQCIHKERCGGCAWGDRSSDEVAELKLAAVRARFANVEWRELPAIRVRDRADLVWERGADGKMRLGLYGREERGVVDLRECMMMSEPLEAWFREFRQRPPPITRGSVRLRVAPTGERGVWLDFANQDVKALFEERAYLHDLSARAFVEVGQRRKALSWRDGQPKLIDPELRAWFETYDGEGGAISLYGPVGGFSQAGFAANRALVGAVSDLAATSGLRSWLELFCGSGNLALALAARGHSVEAWELDPLAVAGLERSVRERGLPVNVRRADVYLKTSSLPPVAGRGVLVDPPRAGLRELLTHLERGWRPEALLYVSCFTEVFLQDATRLEALGYRCIRLVGVDQFPFTPHNEWIALFVK